jgi:Glycosidases
LDKLRSDLGRIRDLGCDALYLGPVFESVAHGYDPVSWTLVDRRLGTKATLQSLTREAKRLGMRIVFDGVFNHTGREHPWFRALCERGEGAPGSQEARRYEGVRAGRSPAGDPFMYEGWAGYYDLAKLNLRDEGTKAEIIDAALSWIADYDIDGIRLDAADCLDMGFLGELAAACRARKDGLWLMGEVVFGDYRKWTGTPEQEGVLDSITNYECYKGLWSSLSDANFHEIAWSLKRQFGEGGVYKSIDLYSFADNHDVDRVASKLERAEQLYPLYCLLFTMPGIPSIYYGSERGAKATKEEHSDWPLRPTIGDALSAGTQPDLEKTIRRLSDVRRNTPALRSGAYRELAVAKESLAFEREAQGQRAIVAVNGQSEPTAMELRVGEGTWRDELNGGCYRATGGVLRIDVPKTWARILVKE